MEVFAEGAYPADAGPAAVSVGVYDGVHLGHRHVLERLAAVARAGGLPTAVVTFDPHPAVVVAPHRAPLLLTSLERRLELLAAAGVDRCVVVGFDEAVANETPSGFVRRVLVGELNAAAVVVGENFRFGHDRGGDVALLEALAGELGYGVEPVALDAVGGDAISSTRIRSLVAHGDVAGAAVLLGRAHEVEGVVVKGDGRGRGLGYPTANLAVDDRLAVPGVGIYAGTWRRPSKEVFAAAISIGRRPTFVTDGDVAVEAYLLDADAELYGERGRVSFATRLRDEERFESVDALVRQIAQDVAATRTIVRSP